AIVVEEAVCGIEIRRQAIKGSSVNQKNILPAVIVVIYEGGPASGGFQEGKISLFITVDHSYIETSLLRHIFKPYPQAFIRSGLARYSVAGDRQTNNDWRDPTHLGSLRRKINIHSIRTFRATLVQAYNHEPPVRQAT